MKRLGLLRHAKSNWDEELGDFERPLAPRGRSAAAAMGAAMRERDMHFDSVLASPARRVAETIATLESTFGPLGAEEEARIYLAFHHVLLDLVRDAPKRDQSLLLVGHNPGLHRLAIALARPSAAIERTRLEDKYPTGALAVIDLDIARWRDAEPGCGMLVQFLRPRDLEVDGE